MTDSERIVERIIESIKNSGLSRTAFARLVGIDPSNLIKMLAGSQALSAKTIKKIASGANINETWLMTGEGEMLRPASNTNIEQHVKGDGNKFSGTGNVSDGVPTSLFQQALNEVTAMRQLVAESTRNTNDLSRRIMTLLEGERTQSGAMDK